MLLTSSLNASEIYRFNFYDVYLAALGVIDENIKEGNRAYNLYALDAEFSSNNLDFVTSFFMKYDDAGRNKNYFLCLKLNSAGDIIEFRDQIKPIFNDPNRPSEPCSTFKIKTKSSEKTLYDIDYFLILKTLDDLLTKNNASINPESRTKVVPFVARVKGEPNLYFSSYYKYKKNEQIFFACQIINKYGEQVSFENDIPEKKEKSFFPNSFVSKPSYRCKVS